MILNPSEFMFKEEESDWNEISKDVIPILVVDYYKSLLTVVPKSKVWIYMLKFEFGVKVTLTEKFELEEKFH